MSFRVVSNSSLARISDLRVLSKRNYLTTFATNGLCDVLFFNSDRSYKSVCLHGVGCFCRFDGVCRSGDLYRSDRKGKMKVKLLCIIGFYLIILSVLSSPC